MDKPQNRLKQLLNFLHASEKLKMLLRHSWLSSGRQESVAEHTWRLALMAIVLEPEMGKHLNLEKILKMVIVHDLAEIYAGDHHAWKGKLKNKYQKEKRGLGRLLVKLPGSGSNEIKSLWEEYERCKTQEAKFVKAIDKLEVLIQHDEADLSTWVKEEYTYNLVHGKEEVKFDKVLQDLKNLIDYQTARKIKNGRINFK